MWKVVLAGVLGLVVAAVVVVLAAEILFDRMVAGEVTSLGQNAKAVTGDVITEDDLIGLPEPVQRYLRYSGIVGKPRISTVYLEMKGEFRGSLEQPWMPFTAQEYYSVKPNAYLWHAKMKAAPLITMNVRDRYVDGRGEIFGKLLSLVTVLRESGSKIDQGAYLRYVNEMMWFPTAYLEDGIVWEAIDEHSVRMTMSDGGMEVSAVLTIDEEGRLVNFEAERYQGNSADAELETWATPLDGYAEFEGVRLPSSGVGVWHLDEGDFAYIRLELVSIAYDADW